jgi:hypothetical protein
MSEFEWTIQTIRLLDKNMIIDPVPEHMDAVLCTLENYAEILDPLLEKGFIWLLLLLLLLCHCFSGNTKKKD